MIGAKKTLWKEALNRGAGRKETRKAKK